MNIKKGKSGIVAAFIMVFSWQLVACGTLFFPEQRGQTSGRIDPKVALLDGIGILFFIVPGVIAFAVDFVTGAIYLPGGKGASLNENTLENVAGISVKNESAGMSVSDLQGVIKAHNGIDVDLSDRNVVIVKVSDSESAKAMTLAFNNTGLSVNSRQYLTAQ